MKSKKEPLVVRYQLHIGNRWSTRLYTYNRSLRALRLAKAFRSDAYSSPLAIVLTKEERAHEAAMRIRL